MFTPRNRTWVLTTRLRIQDNGSARVGAAVSIAGNQLLVGAPGEGGGVGTAYIAAVQ